MAKRRPGIEGSIGWDEGEKLVQVTDRVTLSPIDVAARSRLALTSWPCAFDTNSNAKLKARILLISPILGYSPAACFAFLDGSINQGAFLLLEVVEQLAHLLRGHLAVRLRLTGVGLFLALAWLGLFLFVLFARGALLLSFLFFLLLILSGLLLLLLLFLVVASLLFLLLPVFLLLFLLLFFLVG